MSRVSLVGCALIACVFGFVFDLRAASNSAAPTGLESRQSTSAALHISVNLVPVVQTENLAPLARRSGAITYLLESAPREQKHELSILPPNPQVPEKAQKAAVLDTLIVVPQ